MKSIIEYIYEELSTARKNLIDYLSNEENSIRDKDIERAMEVVSNLNNELYEYFTKTVFVNNSESFKALMNKLEHAHLKREFMKLFSNNEELPSLEDLENNNNIFTLFKDKFKTISEENKKTLFNIILNISTTDNKRKGIGKGEIFLNTFIKNSKKGHHGDITIDGVSFEIKGGNSKYKNGGRIKGNNNKIGKPEEIVNKINTLLNKKGITENLFNKPISGPNNIKEICKNILDNTNLSIKEIFNIFAQGYYYQLFKDNMNDNVKKYIDNISNDVNSDNIGNKLIENVHGILAIIAYQMADNWDKLFIINVDTGDYHIIDANKNVSFEKINDLAKECEQYIVFKNGPSTSSGANDQNFVSTIYVK